MNIIGLLNLHVNVKNCSVYHEKVTYDRFMNFVLFTHDKKYSANKYTLLEIIMENPGLRFKKILRQIVNVSLCSLI